MVCIKWLNKVCSCIFFLVFLSGVWCGEEGCMENNFATQEDTVPVLRFANVYIQFLIN